MTTVNSSTDSGQGHHHRLSHRSRLVLAAAGLALAAVVGGGSFALVAASATPQHPTTHSTAGARTPGDWPWTAPSTAAANS